MHLPAHFEENRPELLHELLQTHPLGQSQGGDEAEAMAKAVAFCGR
ncbi:hypothetical protein [Collimonas silvisoli]|nr:hypothetical protein [Collimonas silvisoli]